MRLLDVSGIEPEALELTPVDWTSHPAEAEDLYASENTPLCRTLDSNQEPPVEVPPGALSTSTGEKPVFALMAT